MGETPDVLKIACPGCETQFRLKPKKGRLPNGPVPCPKCADKIPVVEENIRRSDAGKTAAEDAPSNTPGAQAFTSGDAGSSSADKPPKRSSTRAGSPVNPPVQSDSVDRDTRPNFDRTDLSDTNPKSTFLGMGSALEAVDAGGDRRDKTAVVDGETLDKIRSESSVVDDDAPQDNRQPDASEAESDSKGTPGQMVLGKIDLKKRLRRATRKKRDNPQDAVPPSSDQADESGDAAKKSAPTKPSLSKLLHKARQRKDELDLSGQAASHPPPPATDDDFDRALDDLADETARSIDSESAGADTAGTDVSAAGSSDGPSTPPDFDSGDSSMVDLMRRRVAENQQPGAASERRGSGYIRLPTAEIQEVLGQGAYRLRVEDIVYEPIDKDGLTQLVKRGVLLGAAEIAEPDGDWMPIAEHPVFSELRGKMAREAHDLLKDYQQPSADQTSAPEAPQLPGRRAELPAPQASLPGRTNDQPTAGSHTGPTLEAKLEQEAEQAARELFGDADSPAFEETASPAAPPRPPRQQTAAESTAAPPPGADSDTTTSPNGGPSRPERARPATASEANSSAPGNSVRTWIPILVAVAVLVTLAALAFSPVGRPYLDRVLDDVIGHGQPGQPTPAAAGAEASSTLAAAVSEASSTVAAAAQVDPADPALQKAVARRLFNGGDWTKAARVMSVLWQDRRQSSDFAARFARTLLKAERFADARRVAVAGEQLDAKAHDFRALFKQAITDDPALNTYQIVDVSQTYADHMKIGREGDRLVLELTGGESEYRFKPSQADWTRGWRSGIAVYRLCQIISCQFNVPRTRPARIDRATLEGWTAKTDEPADQQMDQLNWVDENGHHYVYGALQDKVGAPARFPIERTNLWRDWLTAGRGISIDSTPIEEAIASLQGTRFYTPLVEQIRQTNLSAFAGQLSSVLVVDFLTDNWSRFQAHAKMRGANLHVSDGELLSRDNGTAFRPRASKRVSGRFGWISRYSADTITSLRMATPKLVGDRLFPEPSAGEKARLELFWSQRRKALARVDELVDEYGPKEVLAFE